MSQIHFQTPRLIARMRTLPPGGGRHPACRGGRHPAALPGTRKHKRRRRQQRLED